MKPSTLFEDVMERLEKYYIRPQNVESNLTFHGSVDYISAERTEFSNTKKGESFAQGVGELLGQIKALHIV
ncbi:26048_t:CDS:2 [Dentiscutata erythropus]|uniref:26048_t:CDS:1 n=1 Tax=Dentiscutata erythropus TaxID=1348616 RepID=A0A9N9IXT5_9GLOM|nr:26048_t:CDS:2 [Dentiscutata erythropus]